MALIKGYPEGSDLSILNAYYQYASKNPDTGKYEKDYMVISYKDNITQQKKHEIIYEPTYLFYQANEDVSLMYNNLYIDKDKVHPIECKYSELEKTIAELTGNLDFFYENIRAGNRRGNRALHKIPSIFNSDSNIEDHYRYRFAIDYKNEVYPVDKAYFDIEVDTKYMAGDFPELGECPINAVSYVDDKTHSINVFLLRNENNPLIQEFEDNFKDSAVARKLFEELQQFIIENAGGQEKAAKFDLLDLNFNFMFFDDEIELLKALFSVINHNSPDFMLAWNMAFDIPYIIERCYALGVDPALILSSQDYEVKYARYYIDELHKNDYELRGDYYSIAADTVYIDQLVQFASRRKGQAAFPNFKLDTAADIITKGAVRKLDYSHITTNLTDLPYLNYKIFVFYNIMDTIAQKCIEKTVEDVDYIYMTALNNDTRYSKCHRQTVYLANRARKYFYSMGYILGNNCNTGESVSYMGALVGDPTHNSDYAKVKENGQVYNLVDNSDDFDFKSLYPSTTRENNMAPDTIIGKIFIDNPVHKLENPYHEEMYDRGGQYIEDLVTGNALEFGRRWLQLATFKELLADVEEYFQYHIPAGNRAYEMYTNNGMMKPFLVRPNVAKDALYKPFVMLEEGEMIKPFQIFDQTKVGYIQDILNKTNQQ